jgi:4'-phosphopantetheinyl transferase
MTPAAEWPLRSAPPDIVRNTVHIWRLPLDLTAAQIASLRRVLTSDEQSRADRFRADRHRDRFIACRAQVRQLLGGYLDERPERFEFCHGPQGKPALAAPWNRSGIQFNVSNSQDLALCAVDLDHEVGVDIEHLREGRDHDGLAERFFALREVEALRCLPPDQQTLAFFNCWTRKEAVLKAVGTGIAFPLDRLEVTLAPGQPAQVLAFDSAHGAEPAGSNWWLAHLEPAPGYIGALAARGEPEPISRWTFEPSLI